MSAALLGSLPDYTDVCGCSPNDGRCPAHRDMMVEIHRVWQSATNRTAEVLWSLSDGYGEPGYVPAQGYDWSGIRDSSTDAIEAMFTAVHS